MVFLLRELENYLSRKYHPDFRLYTFERFFFHYFYFLVYLREKVKKKRFTGGTQEIYIF